MPIKFPEKCKGVTSGMLRQLNQNGATNANGGVFTKEWAKQFSVNNKNIYFNKTEPAGAFMESLENTKKLINENTEAIMSSGRKLVETAREASKQMTEVSGKFRDGTEKLGVAIDKLNSIAKRGDFAEVVYLAESLATSLERLAALDEKGALEKVMKALSSRGVE